MFAPSTIVWHCEGFRPAVQCIQRDSLFIHVLLRELYVFLLCCVYVTVWCNYYYEYFWGLLLLLLFFFFGKWITHALFDLL